MNNEQQTADAEQDSAGAEAAGESGAPEETGDEVTAEDDNYAALIESEMQGCETITEQKLLYKAMRNAKRNAKRTLLFQAVIRALPDLPKTDKNKLVDFTTKEGRRVRFRYAGLDKILENVLKPLRDEGVGLFFTINGRRLIGHLVHKAGGHAKSWLRVPKKLEAAELQSELSKRRRYILIAMVNMAAEESEDSLPRGSERSHSPRGTRTRGAGDGAGGRAGARPGQTRPGPQNRAPAGAGAAQGARAAARPAARAAATPAARAGDAKPATARSAATTGETTPSSTPAASPPETSTPTGAASPPETSTPTGTRTRQANGPKTGSKPRATNLNPAEAKPKPKPAAETPAAARTATTSGGPPAADPNRPMAWLYEDNATSNRLRELLPQLNPKQAADLRKRFRDKPADMLREAEELHQRIYGDTATAPPEGDPTPPAETTGQQTAAAAAEPPAEDTNDASLEKAFTTLKMPAEDEEALRTEYSGRDDELLAMLRRMYRRRTGQSEGNN